MSKQKLRKKLMNTEVKLTPKDLRKIKDGATMEAVEIINIIPLMILRDEFGFGRVRLERYLEHLNTAVQDFNDGRFNIKDVADVIEDETGVVIRSVAE